MGTPLPLPKWAEPLKFSAYVYCGQTAVWIKMALGMEVGLRPSDCVRWGPSPLPKKDAEPLSPILDPFLLRPNGYMHQDATCYGGRPQPWGLYVRWGPSPIPKKCAEPPIFSPYLCGQMAGWIEMPLGTEIGLSPGDTV